MHIVVNLVKRARAVAWEKASTRSATQPETPDRPAFSYRATMRPVDQPRVLRYNTMSEQLH
jgi:hypothetical protein